MKSEYKVESEMLKNALPEYCQYDGVLYDISQDGMQIQMQGNHIEVFENNLMVISEIITDKVSMNLEFVYETRWCFYDENAKCTFIGGRFIEMDEERKKALAFLISSMQSKMYHKYV